MIPRRPVVPVRVVRALLATFGCGLAAVPAAAAPVVAGFERFHRAAPAAAAEGGLLLLGELNCVACHRLPGAEGLPPRPAPLLGDVGARLDPAALAAFLAHPAEFKPGTLMPRTTLAAAEVSALAAYLGTLGRPRPEPELPAGSVEAGRRLYHAVGCVACHAADPSLALPVAAGEARPPEPLGVVPLALGARYDRAALVRFLIDPLAARPDGRMPDSHLTPAEAADVAAYLQRARGAPASTSAAAATTALVAEGRRLYTTRGCAACHGDPSPGPAAAAPPAAPELRADDAALARGCLAETPPPRAPDFGLDAAQRDAVRAALRRLAGDDSFLRPGAAGDVGRFLTRMNCHACHTRGGRGGVEPALQRFFTVSDATAEALGEMGNLPPVLDHVGRKLTREWWAKLLWEGGGEVRPYQVARMPAFGRAVSEPVLARWEEADRREPPVAIDVSGRQLHQRAGYGRTLMGTQDGGLGCITCHGLRERPAVGMSAIPLDAAARRLLPEYFKELLLNPQSVQPGTRMPPMFQGRPRANQEVEQIWTYLKEADQQLLPEGLLRGGEYELRPEQAGRTLVFRTFLQGAGLDAVAVGTPAGRHAAFDGREVRWALTWRGRFLDALTTWEERAMTPARPLGDAVTPLPGWTPFARAEAGAAEVPHRFRGHVTAADGTPTFRYEAGPLQVEDTLRPDPAGGGYLRVLRVRGGGPGWIFRGAASGATPRPIAFDPAGEARLEEVLP